MAVIIAGAARVGRMEHDAVRRECLKARADAGVAVAQDFSPAHRGRKAEALRYRNG
jgi:hypothetical protein